MELASEDEIARDLELRWELQTAQQDYSNASDGPHREEARKRFREVLRKFTAQVLRIDAIHK